MADLSPSMLKRARTKATAASVGVDFIEMNMREFYLAGRQFGLVIIAANSLLHLHDPCDIRRCFAAIARHLLPGGALAFDVFDPNARILAREPNQRYVVGRFMQDELGELLLEETTDYDGAAPDLHSESNQIAGPTCTQVPSGHERSCIPTDGSLRELRSKQLN